jgi:hypothetical protein
MSLYNMLHGYEPTAALVVSILAVDPRTFPRFRDAYLTYLDATDTTAVMVVLTRTGASNRAAFSAENENMRQLPGYLDDADDEFDSTFALFRYALPDEYQKLAQKHLLENGPPLTLREKTMQATGPDQTTRQRAAAANLWSMVSSTNRKSDHGA